MRARPLKRLSVPWQRKVHVGMIRPALGLLAIVLLGAWGCAAIGAGLRAMGGSDQERENDAQTRQVQAQARCSSDYDCDYGSYCVKEQYATQGVCAQVVDEYGNPTYASPRTDSVRPGEAGECHFDTDCGPGWYCIKGNSLTGHCMR